MIGIPHCMFLRGIAIGLTAFLCALMAGCGGEIELHSGLNEADANEVVAALTAVGIDPRKAQEKKGVSVRVPTAQLSAAVAALRAQGLPRNAFARMGEVFKKDGMISTPMEERGRYLFALSQELESTLSQIDGVILARVHPVLPERTLPGEPAQASSCAVFIKHRPDFDAVLYEERIRQLVAAGIPGLAQGGRTKVSVVFALAGAAGGSGSMSTESVSALMIGIWALCALAVLCIAALGLLAWPRRAELREWLLRYFKIAPVQQP
jgi:type III secretion protein J